MARQRYTENRHKGPRTAARSHQPQNDVERILRFCHQGLPQTSPAVEDEAQHRASRSSVNLPEFGYLAMPIAEAEKLWKFEIKRLMDAITWGQSASAESVFPDLDAGDDILFSPIDGQGSAYLRKLASRALCALYISVLDDEFCDYSREALDKDRVWKAYSYLRRITGLLPQVPGRSMSIAERRREGSRHEPERAPERPSALQTSLKMKESELEHYHHLVDQITATLAFVAIKSDASSWWELVVLACLAKLSTKMKTLAYMLAERTRYHINQDIPHRILIRPSVPEGARDPFVDQYSKQHKEMTDWLGSCIEQVLNDIGADVPLSAIWDNLDICTFLYETGTAATHTHVYQGRWGEIGGTSDPVALSWASNSMELAIDLADKTSSINKSEPSRSAPQDGEIVVNFIARTNAVMVKDVEVQVRNVVHLIVVMTPMSLASPSLASGFTDCLKMTSALSSFAVSSRPPISVKGFLSLKSMSQKATPDSNPSVQRQPRVLSLSESKLMNSGSLGDRIGHRQMARSGYPKDRRHGIGKSPSKIEQLDDLVIQELSIKVKCRRYVYSVFACTTALVIGGLISAFLVGERIPGVDPFNLAMYSWIIGGLVLLISKIVHVSEWTWREFFLGEVACRSLSEVASLTGLDAQEILTHLLSTEGHTILRTGGPYQRCFSKEAVSDGFSIDEMPTVQTLNDAGILLVKVLTLEGPAVILLRLAPGSRGLKSLDLEGSTDEADVCLDPPDGNGGCKAVIARRSVSWVKVLGLYEQPGVRFG